MILLTITFIGIISHIQIKLYQLPCAGIILDHVLVSLCPCIIDANQTRPMPNCNDHASNGHTHTVYVLYSIHAPIWLFSFHHSWRMSAENLFICALFFLNESI